MECWICGAAVSAASGRAPVPVDQSLIPDEDRPYRHIEDDDGDDGVARANRAGASGRASIPSWVPGRSGALPRSQQPGVVPPVMPVRRTHTAQHDSTLTKISTGLLIGGIAVILLGSLIYLLIPTHVLNSLTHPVAAAPAPPATPSPIAQNAPASVAATATSAPTATAVPAATKTALPTHTAIPATDTPAPSATPAPTTTPEPTPVVTATVAPESTASATQAAVADQTYIVQRGDSCSRIANAFGVTVAELIQINQLAEGCPLRPDQQLIIPATAQRTPTRPAIVPTRAAVTATPTSTAQP